MSFCAVNFLEPSLWIISVSIWDCRIDLVIFSLSSPLCDILLLSVCFTAQTNKKNEGTSLIGDRPTLAPYSRAMPRALWLSQGGWRFLVSEVPLYFPSPSMMCGRSFCWREGGMIYLESNWIDFPTFMNWFTIIFWTSLLLSMNRFPIIYEWISHHLWIDIRSLMN